MTNAIHDEPTGLTLVGDETMRAIVQEEYGSSPEDVLRVAELDRPAIGDDEVLVRVHAASVDRGTWHLMTRPAQPDAHHGLRAPHGPRHPTRAGAWRERSMPSARNVTEFEPGDEVYGTGEGSFAEYARADVGRLALKPANLSFEQAAAVPISGVTALQGVRDRAQVQAGEKVLIIGASGGVGTFAVQIAKAFGAEVTGVCSTAKMDLVRALGADHVVDYTRDDFADGEQRYDVILDIGGNSRLSHLRRALTPGGRLVIVGGETDGRWLGGFDRQLRAMHAVPVGEPEAGHPGCEGERCGLDGASGTPRTGRSRRPSTGRTRSARRQRPSDTSWTGRHGARSSSPSEQARRGNPLHRKLVDHYHVWHGSERGTEPSRSAGCSTCVCSP